MKNAEPVMTVTLMGGDMQAQGHAQLLVNIFDLGANLQAAAEMARFRHNQVPNELSLESQLYQAMGAQLAGMGHTVKSANGAVMGGVQSILFTAYPAEQGGPAGPSDRVAGFYRAGSDHRKDGAAVGW
jgi:gamma-glutamyltranspeptidase/glutathione hydrolase